MNRVHNFSAGPAALPTEVLEKAQSELLNYRDKGVSIMEMSHRSPEYTEVDTQAKERLKRLMNLGDDFEIVFLQGGASTQFMQVPMNFLKKEQTADYINTGVWSQKAIKETRLFGHVEIPFSSEASNFSEVPHEKLNYSDNARYVHYTSNNTIYGTQFAGEPETDGIPLVCDASSDFLSRPIDPSRYGVIYAGAQKNLGPSGVTVVILNKEFLTSIDKENIPTILDYRTHAARIFNTPPTFPVYLVNLVLEWIENKGGVSYFEKLNSKKAGVLYNAIDAGDFYRGTAKKNSRSKMNVTFRLPTPELEALFLKEAAEHDLVALKGHRSAGGIRASIYNACTLQSVEALVSFMNAFKAEKG